MPGIVLRNEFLSPAGTPGQQTAGPSGILTPSAIHSPSFADSPSLELVTDRDDTTEKRERRRSKVLHLKKRDVGSPGTPQTRRLSAPLSGLSTTQLSQHYSDCMKLSVENKINSKNAFGLHLIDYMQDMLKVTKLENFQVASSTLDASAKIYAGRVDAIHAETYKVLSGLGHSSDKQTSKETGEEVINEDQQDSGSQENEKKKKKSMKKGNKLRTNLDKITLKKFSLQFEVDPLFQVMSAAFDEGGTSGLLINNLSCYDDSQALVLDSSTVVSPYISLTDNDAGENPIKLQDLKDLSQGIDFQNLQVCPSVAEFSFLNWDENDDTTLLSQSSQHAFDINTEAEPITDARDNFDDMGDGGLNDIEGGDEFDAVSHHSNQDDSHASDLSIVGDGKAAQLVERALNDITESSFGNLMQILVDEPSDYSYFNKTLMRSWAGPEHWKIRQLSKDHANKTNDLKSAVKKKKIAFRLDFDSEIDFESILSKKCRIQSTAKLQKLNSEATSLPKDVHYDADKLFGLFNKPRLLIKRQKASIEGVDDEIDNYNFDNVNDKENFCPAGFEGEDGDDDHCDEFNLSHGFSECSQSQPFQSQPSFLNGNLSILNGTILDGENLVAQPFKVSKIDIPYATSAKKVDVKKLKAAIWNILTSQKPKTADDNEAEEEARQDNTQMSSTCAFTTLIKDLPQKVGGQTCKNLSVPITFVCLLHLANEKILKITSENMEDLCIEQGL